MNLALVSMPDDEQDDFWNAAARDYHERQGPEGQRIDAAAQMDWAVLDPADNGPAAGW